MTDENQEDNKKFRKGDLVVHVNDVSRYTCGITKHEPQLAVFLGYDNWKGGEDGVVHWLQASPGDPNEALAGKVEEYPISEPLLAEDKDWLKQ